MDEHEQESGLWPDAQSLLTLVYFLLVLVCVLMAQDTVQKIRVRRSKASAWTSTTTTIRRLYASVFKK